MATVASSRHVGPIKAKVDEWQQQLSLFSQTLVPKHTDPCAAVPATNRNPFNSNVLFSLSLSLSLRRMSG